MKLLVAVRRVIDYNLKVKIKSDHSDVDLTNLKMAINPFCEIAVEEAIRLKEQGIAGEVVVVSIGSSVCQEQIRSALALGADRGILVETDDNLSALHIAKILKAVVAQEQPQLILMGKQAIDSDNGQTGQMLAALCGISQATCAFEVKVSDDHVQVTREIDGGLQTLQLTLPAVITTDLRLNEPRYAALPNIMKAKRKPLDTLKPDSLGVTHQTTQQLVSVQPPAQRQAGIKVASVDELIDKLRNEAKVMP